MLRPHSWGLKVHCLPQNSGKTKVLAEIYGKNRRKALRLGDLTTCVAAKLIHNSKIINLILKVCAPWQRHRDRSSFPQEFINTFHRYSVRFTGEKYFYNEWEMDLKRSVFARADLLGFRKREHCFRIILRPW